MSRRPTYAQLFSLLARLGFRDVSKDELARAFHHDGSNTLLAFSMMHKADDAPVASGDWLSAETNLKTSGLIDGSLDERFEERTPAERADLHGI